MENEGRIRFLSTGQLAIGGLAAGFFAIVAVGIAAALRLYGLSTQGLEDMDGVYFYNFLHFWFPNHSLSFWGSTPLSYMGGRPSFVWTLFAESLVFQPSVFMVLLHNAVCGILAVALLIWIGERYVGRGVGIFAGLVLGLCHMAVYLSRHQRDGAHTFFFFLLAALLLVVATRRRGPWLYLLAGLAASFGFTGNYVSITSVAALLPGLLAIVTYDVVRRQISPGKALAGLVAYGAGLAFFPLIFELFHPVVSFYLPSWDQPHGWGYVRGFFEQEEAHTPIKSRYNVVSHWKELFFYLRVFWREGWWIAGPAALGLLLSVFRARYRTRTIFLFVLLLAVPVAVHSLTESVKDLARNVWLSYASLALFAGIGWTEAVAFVSRLVKWSVPRVRESWPTAVFTAAAMAVIVVSGFPLAKPAITDRSAAERFLAVTQGIPACVSAPDNYPYHYMTYYFRPEMSCATWQDVQEKFLRERGEYLVILPNIYTKWNRSELALYEEAPFLSASDYIAIEERRWDEARLFDLHDETVLLDRLHLKKTKTLSLPDTVVPATTAAENLQEALARAETHFDLDLDPGVVLELQGRVDLKDPGELLVLAVGTPEEPARHHFEVFGAKLPNVHRSGRHTLTSIQTCFGVKDVQKVRVTLAYVPSPYRTGKPEPAPMLAGFGAAEYTPTERVAEPRYILDQKINRNVYYTKVLSLFKIPRQNGTILGPQWKAAGTDDPTRVYLANGDKKSPLQDWLKKPRVYYGYNGGMELGTPEKPVVTIDSAGRALGPVAGLACRVEPGQYRPGAVYRVTFRGWTNANIQGQVAVVFQPSNDPKDDQWIQGCTFWQPRWQEYSFDFLAPPGGDVPFSVVIKEARPAAVGGLVQVSDITCRELEGEVPQYHFWRTYPEPMVAPRDQSDFRKMAAARRASLEQGVQPAPAQAPLTLPSTPSLPTKIPSLSKQPAPAQGEQTPTNPSPLPMPVFDPMQAVQSPLRPQEPIPAPPVPAAPAVPEPAPVAPAPTEPAPAGLVPPAEAQPDAARQLPAEAAPSNPAAP